MKRRLCAALLATASLGAIPNRSDAGPIKHWGTFPEREVRALAFRGMGFGREPSFTVVQGRDGFVYLRGRSGLYRVLDADGRNEPVAETGECSGYSESYGADDRSFVPRALCGRASHIIVATSTGHRHIVTPVPTWAGAVGVISGYRRDNRFLTSVVPASRGGYWFAYGEAGGIGRIWPSGRSVLRHIEGIGRIRSMTVTGDEVYVTTENCSVGHIRSFVLIDARRYRCPHFFPQPQVAVANGDVWITGGDDGIVERRERGGTRRRWTVGMPLRGIAIGRDGTAYVLGSSAPDWHGHPMIVIVPRRGAPVVRRLPVQSAEGIAVDARDRIWIGDPFWHAATVIAPRGAWG